MLKRFIICGSGRLDYGHEFSHEFFDFVAFGMVISAFIKKNIIEIYNI